MTTVQYGRSRGSIELQMEQCVRLIQLAGLTMGMCMQLKGCVQATVDNFDNNDSNGSINDGPNDVQMVLWTVLTLR